MSDSTERFTSRVANYVRYRPRYPDAVIARLSQECALTRSSLVADVGSGTGMLSALFVANGNQVFGVEPNTAMRAAAEMAFCDQPLFESRNGTAESTGLDGHSVDFVTAGQAFHWFDRDASHREFSRILKPGGWVALVWNERSTSASAFDADYERLLETFAVGYAFVNHRNIDANSLRTFLTGGMKLATFGNSQRLDFEGLKGRLLSSSYAPEPGHAQYDTLLRQLELVFSAHKTGDHVTIHYDTNMYFGQL